MRHRNKANINEEELQISKAVGIALGYFDFVIEALKPAGIDMEFCMSNQAVKSLKLLTSELHVIGKSLMVRPFPTQMISPVTKSITQVA